MVSNEAISCHLSATSRELRNQLQLCVAARHLSTDEIEQPQDHRVQLDRAGD